MRPGGSSADISQSLRSTTGGVAAGENAAAVEAASPVPLDWAVGVGAPLALPARAARMAR
jgi:hypothetical protein